VIGSLAAALIVLMALGELPPASAAAVGALALGAFELVLWSLELRFGAAPRVRVATRRLGAIGAVMAAGAGLGLGLAALPTVHVADGLPLTAAGTAAAAILLTLIARAAR
jgi:hypothetical protein